MTGRTYPTRQTQPELDDQQDLSEVMRTVRKKNADMRKAKAAVVDDAAPLLISSTSRNSPTENRKRGRSIDSDIDDDTQRKRQHTSSPPESSMSSPTPSRKGITFKTTTRTRQTRKARSIARYTQLQSGQIEAPEQRSEPGTDQDVQYQSVQDLDIGEAGGSFSEDETRSEVDRDLTSERSPVGQSEDEDDLDSEGQSRQERVAREDGSPDRGLSDPQTPVRADCDHRKHESTNPAESQLLEEDELASYRRMDAFVKRQYALIHKRIKRFIGTYCNFTIQGGKDLDGDGVPLKRPSMDLLCAVKEMAPATALRGWPEMVIENEDRGLLIYAIIGKIIHEDVISRPLCGATRRQVKEIYKMGKKVLSKNGHGGFIYNECLAKIVERIEKAPEWEEEYGWETHRISIKIFDALQPILALNPGFKPLIGKKNTQISRLVFMDAKEEHTLHRKMILSLLTIVQAAAELHLKMRKDPLVVYRHPTCKTAQAFSPDEHHAINNDWVDKKPRIGSPEVETDIDQQWVDDVRRARPLVRFVGLPGCTALRKHDWDEDFGAEGRLLAHARVAIWWGYSHEDLSEEEKRQRRGRNLRDAMLGNDPLNRSRVTEESQDGDSYASEGEPTAPPSFTRRLEQFQHRELRSRPTTASHVSIARPHSKSHSTAIPPLGRNRSAVTKSTSNSPSRTPKKRRSSSKYADPSKYAHLPGLRDVLEPGLICIFIGANPGISTATSGHAYAHPSNLFWKLLHSSGCTDRRCRPEEDGDLPRLYSMGNTNIVSRPTKDTAELSKAEQVAGTRILDEKILKYKPEAVCIVGKGIWESIWKYRHGKSPNVKEFCYGWQDEKENMGRSQDGEESDGCGGIWHGARVFVATSTSGLAATLKPAQKEEIWLPFGQWVKQRRDKRALQAAK
ncbi:hypothetical protein EJ05DRAFT_500113 [Pseudovirgaria hyperparasitica]|uniref:Uracil-DNA glycosylase-like domain-containing protein n=1 Tax=Pseudovirgaria hyperparasitica TaxID=470096 RepID=A0A6A6WBV7_9PEZI|nr:uncharacterized protein EJ05DRAFT_500113 [Pseudovirgaria hyperparasitica]KAF2758591.1 hypothetical protein EJ05DRAFT_500113 [Pseudovirgaria hyperparasitica]